MLHRRAGQAGIVALAALVAGALPAPWPAARAQPVITTGFNTYGYPGLIDMPTAHSRPDGELAFTSSFFAGQLRNTATFQLLPRLSGSFRYSSMKDIRPNVGGAVVNSYFDRSFSLHYRLMDETPSRPAVAVGLNDFLGTGLYASEYLVASKTLNDRLRLTGGIGWGRLAGVGGFDNPLGVFSDSLRTRSAKAKPLGGRVNTGNWFQGDAALFGGVEWQATERLSFAVEYSSDANPNESPSAFKRESPFNFGATYALRPGVALSAHYLYGSELGAQLTMTLNPKSPPAYGGRDNAPPPVVPRDSLAALGWPDDVVAEGGLRQKVASALAAQGIGLHAMQLQGDAVRLEIENNTYPREAQAIGRTARALTGLMPPGVERFVIVPVTAGMAASEVEIARGDLETLEHDLQNGWRSYQRSQIGAAAAGAPPAVPGRYPAFQWSLKPYITPSLFDPDNPLRADLGAEVSAMFQPMRGVEVSGTFRKKIVGNLDQSTRASTSVLPRVRSDFNLYDRAGDPEVTSLTGAYYFKPGQDIYGRVTAGYLEPMFGGVSAELLWKPVDSRMALGVEVNYAKQRDFNQLFGFQDYDVMTGHVSAYWDIGNGFHTQVDAGRYLAGDWGATFSLDREFENGWRVGAFATLTDVPFSDFGEGSFDKGIRVTVPISWLSGQPTKDAYTATLRPVTRDGGARLNVDGRLYDRVRPLHQPELSDGWGRFWR
ncbi:YjbH domain-containing protein [Rhodovulum adriaticum]|uniref:Exopolysaccharide biosynthesis protein YbjH n=1 Tax=Rhodovulum adriaticum TaxID=35804 RepID=A0A4R2P0G9_RHOAD|nr:YjbH domain-containing protein [Rhodovulum adriaticum]MBK1634120.1 hypothetical protein [Rhodovulum adriaticum]TCP27331.1 exopolysaccharide biosynthesis protein YbjH [Rhodovulum adriaticum]